MNDPYGLVDTRQCSDSRFIDFLLAEAPITYGFYTPRWALHFASYFMGTCYFGESVLLLRKCVENPALVEAVLSAGLFHMNNTDLLAMIRDWKE